MCSHFSYLHSVLNGKQSYCTRCRPVDQIVQVQIAGKISEIQRDVHNIIIWANSFRSKNSFMTLFVKVKKKKSKF